MVAKLPLRMGHQRSNPPIGIAQPRQAECGAIGIEGVGFGNPIVRIHKLRGNQARVEQLLCTGTAAKFRPAFTVGHGDGQHRILHALEQHGSGGGHPQQRDARLVLFQKRLRARSAASARCRGMSSFQFLRALWQPLHTPTA